MNEVHDFRKQLAYSEKASEESFWIAIYQKAFPDMVNCMSGSGDTQSQRMGIDRVILLSNGKTLYIDEKKRRKKYPDFCLEYISVDKTGAPGWMEKDLCIDYLGYAFMPEKTAYLLPWLLLKRGWNYYKEEWKKKYFKVEAINKGYKTISVAVPISIVLGVVKNASIITLESNYENIKHSC